MDKKTAGAGVGAVAAMVAAAAGAYWFYGSNNAAKHRKMARSWMLKARAEVLERVEKAGVTDKDTYMKIVADVMKGYVKAKDVTAAEVSTVTKDLTGAWGHMQKVYKENMARSTPKVAAKKAPAKKAKK